MDHDERYFKDINVNCLFLFGKSIYEKVTSSQAVKDNIDYQLVRFPFKPNTIVKRVRGVPVSAKNLK